MSGNSRLIAVVVLAGVLLLALIIATGGGFSGTGSSSPPAPTSPPAAPTATTGPVVHPAGLLTVTTQRLHGHTWRFAYSIKNTGGAPIAGFQINASRANLFHIHGKQGWAVYGAGVCGGNYPGVLVYWSTGATSGLTIRPHGSAQFGFDVNTTGAKPAQYSLSWRNGATFGTTSAPAPSSMAATGPCK